MNDVGKTSAQRGQGALPWLSRLLRWPGAVFLLAFVWRGAMLGFFSLPVPGNDSFFYDGPVVNLLAHGKYANPSLAPALPFSGTRLFCAYPPLYQFALWGWMSVFGVSAYSAMAFHLVLFGVYVWLLLAILRRLGVPTWAIHAGGLFLWAITFDDRPDSLGHVLGIGAVYALVRSRSSLDARGGASAGWAWVMAALGVLTLVVSVQIGAVYGLLIGCGVLACRFAAKDPIPFLPMTAMALAPVALVAMVVLGFPSVWAGFLEHARQTPSVSGLRLPLLSEGLKIVRTVPGILAVAGLLPLAIGTALAQRTAGLEARRFGMVAGAGIIAPLVITGAALFVLTPNSVMFALQLQPLLVAVFLAFLGALRPASPRRPWQLWLCVALAGLGGVRAAGLGTWGVACAFWDPRADCLRRVESELTLSPRGSTVVLSSAYLYGAALHAELNWVHSDWMAPADRRRNDTDWQGLTTLRPGRVILTQFDYYRRFQPLFEQLRARPELARFTIRNTASLSTPDAIPSLQKVVQHVSWAPVIVTLEWKLDGKEGEAQHAGMPAIPTEPRG